MCRRHGLILRIRHARGGPDAPGRQAERPAVAAAAGTTPADAAFEGHRIDLASNWEQAQACIVLRQAQVVECFRTSTGRGSGRGGHAAVRGRRVLVLLPPASLRAHLLRRAPAPVFDRGDWQNLTDYGFNDQLSSYITGGCYTYLAEHTNGVGAFYPGPTWAWAGVPYLNSGWDNRISSLYMA